MNIVEQDIQRLVAAGEELPEEVAQALLAHGPEAVPALLGVLTDETLQMEDAPGDGWAPVHAADLLGELKDPRALPTMLLQLRQTEPGEYLQETLTDALIDWGEGLIEPALAVLREHPRDAQLHDYVGEVLSKAELDDERVLAALLRELELCPESGAIHLAEYGDPAALPALSRAFDAFDPGPGAGPLHGHTLVELAATIEGLGGELTPEQRRRVVTQRAGFEDLVLELAAAMDKPAVREERPGRNEPCWCGSGQKYKRCHLSEDQQGDIA
jgi:hypothetical protein